MEKDQALASRLDVAERLRAGLGGAAVAIGALVLVGGLLGVQQATSWGESLPRAVPASGVLVLLLGLAQLAGPRRWVSHVLVGLATACLIGCITCRITRWVGPLQSWSWDVPGHAVPSVAALALYAALIAGCIALGLGRPKVAQVAAVPAFLAGAFIVTSMLYGDRPSPASVDHLSNPIASAPVSSAAVLLSVSILAATPTVGLSAWLSEDTPGRRAIRRLMPVGIVVQLAVAGAAQWMDLEGSIGSPRTWTLVMFAVAAGVAALSASAADLVDRLSASARRVEVTELRLIAADRAAKVAEIARLLAAAASTEDVAEIVNRAVAGPFGASGASIGLVDEDRGTLRIVHGPAVPEATRAMFPDPPLTTPMALTEATRTAESVLIEDERTNRARYPDGPASLPGVEARAVLPLRDGRGRCFGAVAVAWARPVVFDDHTRATLETVGQLVAQTLERTRLGDAVAREAERNRQLSIVAEALGTARDVQRVVDVLQERLPGSVGASFVTVGIVDPLAAIIHRYLPATTDPMLAERFAFDSLEAHRPLVDAARDGVEVVIAGMEDLRAKYPELADAEEAIALRACVNLPLMDVSGRSVGSLAVAWEDERLMHPDRVETLSTIAQMTGQTLERVRLAEAEHRLVKSLQERILRPMPPLRGFALAARYRPAAVELGMGGDWFEGIELEVDGPQRLAVVVGDVVGHGIDAISDMSYLRSALATLLRTGAPLGELFTAVADAVDPMEVTATALAAVLDACSPEVQVLAAGHPPPIVVSADGVCEVIETGRQPLIGVAPLEPVRPARLHLSEGATLALYTDGLVEERRRSIDEGIGRLGDLLVETRHLPVEEQVDAVLGARVAEGHSEDDIALVLIRRTDC